MGIESVRCSFCWRGKLMSHCDCMPAIESPYDRKDRVRERKKEHVCVKMRGRGGEIMNHSLQRPFKNQSYLSDSLPSPAFFSHYQNIKTFVSRSKLRIPTWADKRTVNLIVFVLVCIYCRLWLEGFYKYLNLSSHEPYKRMMM